MYYLKYFLLAQFIIISTIVVGQRGENFFSGTVRDNNTQNPIPFATVYVNGSTTGCFTNEKGEFKLKGLTYPCKVVVSQISYSTKVLEIDKNIEGSEIFMVLKVIELKEVTVESKSTDARTNNLRKFKTWFLGSDYWGKRAELLNDNVLMFFKDLKGFHATASAPLEINLPELGYKLRVDLVHFLINNNTLLKKEQCSYTAFYYFTPIVPKTKIAATTIKRNREKAYYCSALHFCRSLYNDSLSANGYEILRELNSYEQSFLYPVDIKKEYIKNENSTGYLVLSSHKTSRYIIYYYQKNGFPINILNKEKKPKPDKEFLSRFYFIKDTCIIRENGTITDYSLMFDGKIGDKNVGSMLPENYYPNL